jgi:hypothetical protein
MISDRTKAGLAAAKARGVKLETRQAGALERARAIAPILWELAGMSARSVAAELNARRVKTPSGALWSAKTVIRARERLTVYATRTSKAWTLQCRPSPPIIRPSSYDTPRVTSRQGGRGGSLGKEVGPGPGPRQCLMATCSVASRSSLHRAFAVKLRAFGAMPASELDRSARSSNRLPRR